MMPPSSWNFSCLFQLRGLLVGLWILFGLFQQLPALSSPTYSAEDSLRLKVLVDSVIGLDNENPELRASLINQIITESEALSYHRGMVNGYNQQGNLYYDLGKFLQSRNSYLKALPLTDSIKSRFGKAMVLDNLGSSERLLGNYPASMDYHQRARTIYEEEGILAGVGSSSNNIAILFKIQGKNEEAMAEYKGALKIGKKIKTGNRFSGTLINIGILWLAMGEPDSAAASFNQLFEMDPLPDSKRLGQAYSSLSEVYLLKNDLDSALICVEKGFSYADGLGDRFMETSLRFKEGNILRRMGQTSKARPILLEALAGAEEMGVLELEKTIYRILTEMDEAQGNYRGALENHRKMIAVRDSLLGKEQQQALLNLQELYKYEKKKKEVAQLNLELTQEVQVRQEKELELRQSEKRIWVLVALAALLLLVVGFVVAKLLGNARQERLLKEKQELTERSLREKEVLVSEVHHRVKNNLQVIYNILDLQSRSLDDEIGKQALQDSMLRVSSMSLVHNELYHQENLSGIQLSTYFPRLLGHIQDSFAGRLEGLSLEAEVEGNLWLDLDSAVPLGMVVNELVTNALKHAFPDGKGGDIRVRLKREGPALRLEVEDNGIGKSGNIRSGAFGSKLVKSLLRQLKGEMEEYIEDGTLIAIVIRKFKEVKP